MTPREKAVELVHKFGMENQYYERAKQCALIHVDEMITKLVELSNGEFTFIHDVEYYQQVKQEIEKL
jgi:hypothetical protein